MKKNDGFIATSLIYSFFLVFIAVILALISSYVANTTILNQFNSEVMDELNNETHTISLYVKNSRIYDNNVLEITNILQNSSFDSMNLWEINGTCSNNNSILNCNTDSYIYQNVELKQNHDYYFAITYLQSNDNKAKIYVSGSLENYNEEYKESIETENTTNRFIKASGAFKYLNEEEGQFRIGSDTTTISIQLQNVILIDLTENNLVPEWVDNNLSWFDGRINYVKKEITNNNSDVEFIVGSNVCFIEGSCKTSDDNTASVNINYTKDNNALKFKNINSNVECSVKFESINSDEECPVE